MGRLDRCRLASSRRGVSSRILIRLPPLGFYTPPIESRSGDSDVGFFGEKKKSKFQWRLTGSMHPCTPVSSGRRRIVTDIQTLITEANGRNETSTRNLLGVAERWKRQCIHRLRHRPFAGLCIGVINGLYVSFCILYPSGARHYSRGEP